MIDRESNLSKDPRVQRTTLGRLLLPIAVLLRDEKRLYDLKGSQTYFVKGLSARIALTDCSETLNFLKEKNESYANWLSDWVFSNQDFQNEIESSQILEKYEIPKKDWRHFEKVLTELLEKLPEIIARVNATLGEKKFFEKILKKRIAGAREYARKKIAGKSGLDIEDKMIIVDGEEVSVFDKSISVDCEDTVWRGSLIHHGEQHDWKNIMRHIFANGFLSHYNLRRDDSIKEMRDVRLHKSDGNILGNIFISTSTSSSVASTFANGKWSKDHRDKDKTGMLCTILVRKDDSAVDLRKIDTMDPEYYERYFDPEVNEREVAFIGEIPGENILGCYVLQNGRRLEAYTKNPWALQPKGF